MAVGVPALHPDAYVKEPLPDVKGKSPDAIAPQAGAADTVPVPVCVRNCLVEVVLPASLAKLLAALEYSRSPSVKVARPVPPLVGPNVLVTSVVRLTLLQVAAPAEDNDRMNWLVQLLPP